jgi:HNH endonuclease
MPERKIDPDHARLDRIVAEARRAREERATGYREQALKIYPWICGRCAREFTRANLQLLEVHHRDHNHDNNPPDGSNWELLCTYCHENEHQRFLTEHGRDPAVPGSNPPAAATHQPFADLKALLKKTDRG